MDSTTKVLITQSDKLNTQSNNLPSTDGELGIENEEKVTVPTLSGKYILNVIKGSLCSLIQIKNEEFVTSMSEIAQRIRGAIGMSEDDLEEIICAANDKLLELRQHR